MPLDFAVSMVIGWWPLTVVVLGVAAIGYFVYCWWQAIKKQP